MTNTQRYGLRSVVDGNRVGGELDDLNIEYRRNNHLRCANDLSIGSTLEASGDFVDMEEEGDDEFEYDELGRMTADANCGITSITYCPVSQPLEITTVDNSHVSYIYDAIGRKWGEYYGRQSHAAGTIPDDLTGRLDSTGIYDRPVAPVDSTLSHGKLASQIERYLPGGFVYGPLSYIRLQTPHGYMNRNGEWHAYVHDFQGNIVVVTTADADGGIKAVQRTAYYPDGVVMAESTGQQSNRYLYSGKQIDTRSHLALYDYTARTRHASLPIFHRPDPLATTTPGISPYAYCSGDPLNYIDPTGMLVLFINGFDMGQSGVSEYWEGQDKMMMNILHDYKPMYLDGSPTIWYGRWGKNNAKNRFNEGYKTADKIGRDLLDSLNEGETIKVVTHSMGAAYAKGFNKRLNEIYGEIHGAKNENAADNTPIEIEIDIAPFQPTEQEATEGVRTVVVQHRGDLTAGFKPMKGAEINVYGTIFGSGHLEVV